MLSKPTKDHHNYGEAYYRDYRRLAWLGGGYVGIVDRQLTPNANHCTGKDNQPKKLQHAAGQE